MLIVVDMQNDFVTGPLGNAQAQAILPAVNQKIAKAQRVVFTLDTHAQGYLGTQEGKLLPVPHCIDGTKGHALAEAMHVPAGSEVVKKGTFGSVDLARQVQALFEAGEIDRVELIGVCTDICVSSNALLLKAFCPELPIFVDAACCAGVTPERHKAALTTMKACQILIINETDEK